MFEKTSRERLRNQVSKIEAQDKHRKHVQVHFWLYHMPEGPDHIFSCIL